MFVMSVYNLIIFIFFIVNINGFNIDTKHPIIYFYNNTQLNDTRIFRNTHFGYSVILYEGDTSNKPWIQIGAPKSNDSNNNYFEPGAIFRCNISEPCNLFPVDASEASRNSRPIDYGRKKYQPKKDEAWIGGSMDIDMKNKRVVVCGHRWVNNRTYPDVTSQEYHITGACFWSKTNETNTKELLPITGKTNKWYLDSTYYHSKGQAGMSVHCPDSSLPQLVMGAPGIYNWKGSIIKYIDNKQSNQQVHDDYSKLIIGNSKDLFDLPSFGYFGYSISSGYLFSSKQLHYVAGAPRAASFKGKIIVFNLGDNGDIKTVKQTIQGQMTGEYFGAAIAVGDINGDKLDDVIVGAPRHTDKMDEGKIYIFYGNPGGSLRPSNQPTITGNVLGGQFGTAIQSLGDLDNDQCADIAVGAPYENDNHGTVYIYNGRKKEQMLVLSQKIEGKNIYPLIKGFGISFSRPTDIDGNNVNDFAVGSYLSENAVILRSRPVITLKMYTKTRHLKLERNTTNFKIEICLSYEGKYAPQQLNIIRKIKMDENNGRIYLSGDKNKYSENTQTINLNNKQDNCQNIDFGLAPTTNYLDPIKIKVTQALPETITAAQPILINQYTRNKDNFCKNCPIVKIVKSTMEKEITIPYTLNCGSDNICNTDLSVYAEFQNLSREKKFVIGSHPFVTLKIYITNKKENAYLTKISVKLPENIDLQEVPTNCNEDTMFFTVITCDVDNPLKMNATKIVTLNFDMTFITNSSQNLLSFNLTATSESNELNKTDNTFISNLHLLTNASIEIKGNAEKDVYYYPNNTKTINSTHLYKVQKSGVSPLNYFKINVHVPVAIRTENGVKHFLSIFKPIGVQGDQPFSCDWEDPYIHIEEKVEKLYETNTMTESKREKRSTSNNSTNNKMFIVPINNKVAFLNCSSTNVICKNLTCEIGPFQRALKVASLQVKMVLNMTVLQKYVLQKDKSIIYFSTDGNVKEINGPRYTDIRISNVFLKEPIAQHISLWIIIVSIIAGILILLLIIFGLVKAGFFKRTVKKELEALKQQEDKLNPKVPTSLCFLDWQLSHVGPPVLDLFYFMYACTDKQLRDEHYDDLIKHYHQTLSERTAELGSNIEKLYPFSILQEQLLKYGRYGMAIGIMLLQFLLSDATEIPDINKVFDEDDPLAAMEKFNCAKSKNADIYNIRMRDVILHCVERKYI